IPIHWDINGQPDKFVGRDQAGINFWLTPGILAAFVLLTLVLPWLSPRSFEVESFRGTYGYVMALVSLLFLYIHGVILWSTLHPEAMNIKAFVCGILVFFAFLGNVLGRVRRNFWMGIRTPWTLANDNVWIRTHRLAGWLFVLYGILGCVAVLL